MVWESNAKNAGFSSADKPWLPISTEHTNRAVNVQEKDTNSILQFTRWLIEWRKNYEALLYGDIKFVDVKDENILAFEREFESKKMLCLFNLSDKETSFELSSEAKDIEETKLSYSRKDNIITLPAWGAYFGDID